MSTIQSITYNNITKRWDVTLSSPVNTNTGIFSTNFSSSAGGFPYPVFGDSIVYNSTEDTISIPIGVQSFSFVLSIIFPAVTPQYTISVTIENSSSLWAPNTAFSTVDYIKQENRIYKNVSKPQGVTGSTPPVHTSGQVLNGTSLLEFLGFVVTTDKTFGVELTNLELPETLPPVGQATAYTAEKTVAIPGASGEGVSESGGGTVTTTDIEFDYSVHLDRIVTALEQSSLANTIIANNTTSLLTTLNSLLTVQNSIANSQNLIESYQKAVKELAEGSTGEGIRILGPWEWLGLSSIIRLYEEQGVDLTALKAKVDAVPKS